MKKKLKKLLNISVPAAASPAEAKSSLLKTYIKIALVLAALVPATVAYLSIAWFAKNDNTSSTGGGINTQIVTGNLYIAAGDAVPPHSSETYRNTGPVTVELSGSLYPISTPDCIDWYYVRRSVNAWDPVNRTSLIYDMVEAWTSTGVYSAADDSDDSLDFTAFNLATYVLYTDPESQLDVYINPEDLISVTPTGDNIRGLTDALRIGIAVDEDSDGLIDAGELKLVYVPVAEDGTGNSSGSEADTYHCIAYDADMGKPWLSDISYPIAEPGDLVNYTPEGADGNGGAALCGVTGEEGTVIHVYIWLEGTDAQAIIGSSDSVGVAEGDDSRIDVTLSFTGLVA